MSRGAVVSRRGYTSMLPARSALVSMKSRRGSTSSPISMVNTRSASMASSICTLQQAAHGGVHGGFPQLRGVHFAQAFVALAAGGAFGLGDQPVHGLAEVADFFFLLALAFAAHDAGALAQQAAEGVGGLGQRGVVGAVHEVLRDARCS